MSKKHKIIKCNKCKCNNDLTEMIENNDVEIDEKRGTGYIYCIQCGHMIEVVVR